VARLSRRSLRRLSLGLLALVPFALAACEPLPVAPFKDANNGSASDHGWFQGGKAWQGDFGDPDVVRVGSTYYAYSSPTGGRYMPVLTSTDLKTWTIHRNWSTAGPPGTNGYSTTTDMSIPTEIANRAGMSTWDRYNNNDALVSAPSWGLADTNEGPWMTRDYWAPSVFQIGSTWYSYSAVRVSWTSDDPHHYGRFCLTMATSTSPIGPFRDASGSGPIQCQAVSTDPAGSIDPFAFHDPANGKNYLLWKAAGKVGVRPSRLLATELGSDGKPKPGATVVNLLTTNSSQKWEGSTIEAPSMITYGGVTYLFYSANFSGVLDSSGDSNYATGYAVCPQGPLAACSRPTPQTPLLASNGVHQGPGGATPFLDTSGHLRLAYATFWLGETRGDHPRRLQIATLTMGPLGSLKVTAGAP
jgi:hypothetical protein